MPSCSEYRLEMILAGLMNRLKNENLSENERRELEAEIQKLKKQINMD